ncbi:MAG: ABC transporter substrate-binding protein [Planctomycetes bacterium]|nr:ABC transporter substrate-binding protein [Planctomycetota bacterium]MBI3846636.1 ABC transporter substrate-binding protein [Planctomycetota bacterium]
MGAFVDFCFAAATTLVALQQPPSRQSPSTEEIVLGMSTALSGPAADLGTAMKVGVEAALAEANRAGGVQGRKLRLVALDDGYEPSRCAPNMHELIEKHRVLAVIGNVGTPTAVAALPITIEGKTPFLFPFTGAGNLRKAPPDRYVVNFRASYAEETGAMVDALVDQAGLKPDEIAFFTQRDAYGDAGFNGGLAALKRHGLPDGAKVGHGRYERNTLSVENGLADLMQFDPLPRAVIMVGAYAPCAAFIRLAKQQKLAALFLNVSFVGPDSLAKSLGPDGDGVIVTQVVPHFESDVPIACEYRRAIREADPPTNPSFGSLEGYAGARTLLLALQRASSVPTREGLIDALESLGDFDIGLGEPLRLGPGNHQASHKVWPTMIRNGRCASIEWSDLKPVPR